jgi:flavin-binding protein dodecin
MLHRVAFRRVRIEDMRAVREVIADYQVEMTVAIHIRLGRRR